MRPLWLLALAGALLASAGPAEAKSYTFRSVAIDLAGYETGTGVERRIRTPKVDGFVTSMRAHCRRRAHVHGGFASMYSARGARFATRLTVPGEYRILCSLHPVDMVQVVHVRPAGS